jgi:hypothetical protein
MRIGIYRTGEKPTAPPLLRTQGWGIRLRQGYGATSPQSQNPERQRLQNLRSWGVSGIDGLGETS